MSSNAGKPAGIGVAGNRQSGGPPSRPRHQHARPPYRLLATHFDDHVRRFRCTETGHRRAAVPAACRRVQAVPWPTDR